MKEIKLTKNQKCVVDDDVFTELAKHPWYSEGRNGKYYACRRIGSKIVKMHRVILGIYDPKIAVDHINGNSLDNRKSNLRACSWAQNLQNSGLKPSNKSGYKGVCFCNRLKKYRANIRINGVQKHLGVFSDPIDAAKAYNSAATTAFGEFARINKF